MTLDISFYCVEVEFLHLPTGSNQFIKKIDICNKAVHLIKLEWTAFSYIHEFLKCSNETSTQPVDECVTGVKFS